MTRRSSTFLVRKELVAASANFDDLSPLLNRFSDLSGPCIFSSIFRRCCTKFNKSSRERKLGFGVLSWSNKRVFGSNTREPIKKRIKNSLSRANLDTALVGVEMTQRRRKWRVTASTSRRRETAGFSE